MVTYPGEELAEWAKWVVKKDGIERRLHVADKATALEGIIDNPIDTCLEALLWAEEQGNGNGKKPKKSALAVGVEESLYTFTTDLDKRIKGEVVGLPWPPEWSSLGRQVGPMEPGSLTIVAARPSTGKTIFGLQLLRFLAGKGMSVLFVSRELSVTRIVRRHVAHYGANMYNLRSGKLTDVDLRAIETYQKDSKGWKVFYDDSSRTIANIRDEMHLLHPDIVIIDYLQRLAYDTEKEYAAITRIANELQDLTLETDTPVVCLSQLSRPIKGTEAKAPTMSDTRGSGAVEERAANLILLHRKWDTEKEEDKYGKTVEVARTPSSVGFFIVAKCADGESGGVISVVYNGARMQIVEEL